MSDRPDFTESASTVAPGRFQLEAGYTFSDAGEEETETAGELLVRIGLGRRSELRLGLNSYRRIDGPGGQISGFEDTSLGVKIGLRPAPEAGSSPAVALLLSTTLPTGSSELREPHPQPKALLALSWGLGADWALGANLGYVYASAGGRRFTELSGSLSLARSLGESLGAYVEVFGFSRTDGGGPDTRSVNSGVTLLLARDLQLDARVGFGLNREADDYFAGAGVVWRR